MRGMTASTFSCLQAVSAAPRAARAPAVRAYRPTDLPAVYETCLRTG